MISHSSNCLSEVFCVCVQAMTLHPLCICLVQFLIIPDLGYCPYKGCTTPGYCAPRKLCTRPDHSLYPPQTDPCTTSSRLLLQSSKISASLVPLFTQANSLTWQTNQSKLFLQFYLLSPYLSPGYYLSHLVHSCSYTSIYPLLFIYIQLCMAFPHLRFYSNVYSWLSFL